MARKPEATRTAVVPESFFVALGARLLRDFGASASENILYEIGREAGRSFIKIEERSLGRPLRDAPQIRAVLRKFGKEYRWADISLKELDVASKFAIVKWKNAVGVPKGGSSVPMCHVGRGLLSGAADVIFREMCDAIETKCQAMGQEHCEIVVGLPDRVAAIAETM